MRINFRPGRAARWSSASILERRHRLLSVGVIVRVFRFNCPRICPCVVRNVRFSWGFWALARVYGTDALSKRICLSQFGLVVATKILERRRIRAQVAQTGVCLSVTGVLLRDVFKILDGPIGVPD